MKRIVELLLSVMMKKLSIEEEQVSVYRYGINAVIYTFLSTIGLLIIGLLAGQFYNTLFIVGIYYINQTFGGGYHARSHGACFAIMASFLVIGLLLLSSIEIYACLKVMVIFSISILLCFPVVLHPNKMYLEKRIGHFKRRMRIIILLEVIILLLCHQTNIFAPLCIGIIFSAVSKVAGLMFIHRN